MRAAAFILALVLALLLAEGVQAGGTLRDNGAKWTSFVIHINQGPVDELVRGGQCVKGTLGCARRRPSPVGALLDGECWITVPVWEPIPGKLTPPSWVWAHELGHSTDGGWHS